MNILLLDDLKLTTNTKLLLNSIKEQLVLNWNIFNPHSTDELKQILKNNSIDLLIIDMTINEYRELYTKYEKKLNKLHTILLINDINCKYSLGCKHCKSFYKRVSLVKPVKMDTLYETINNFDKYRCGFDASSYDINSTLEKVFKKYRYYSFDKSENKISLKEYENNQSLLELVELVDLLNKNNIDFKMNGSKEIEYFY